MDGKADRNTAGRTGKYSSECIIAAPTMMEEVQDNQPPTKFPAGSSGEWRYIRAIGSGLCSG